MLPILGFPSFQSHSHHSTSDCQSPSRPRVPASPTPTRGRRSQLVHSWRARRGLLASSNRGATSSPPPLAAHAPPDPQSRARGSPSLTPPRRPPASLLRRQTPAFLTSSTRSARLPQIPTRGSPPTPASPSPTPDVGRAPPLDGQIPTSCGYAGMPAGKTCPRIAGAAA